ncbi:transmembrane protein 205 [Copidosoma floridanum]|uniref:transmembrane protein 205 n=1 Tax=Copidosoma floridanum TaxID=29053 RepID=UPI0006C9A2E1|nr:transmembrane protein 205 [Copidosoma floridanum]
MCVRTVASSQELADENPPLSVAAPTVFSTIGGMQQQKSGMVASTGCPYGFGSAKNGLTKAKEKYMKLHEEMLEREAAESRTKSEGDGEGVGDEEQLHKTSGDEFAWNSFAFKRLAGKLRRRLGRWQDSKIYKVLFCTAQPAHVITIAAVLCVTSALVPSGSERTTSQAAGQPRSQLTSFVYLASFVVHFGSQIWMTFVSGLSLYFALPRHAFGEVQRILFPRYFTLNACLSLTTLLIYVKHHPAHSWDSEIAVQVISMGGAFFLELLIRLYLTPTLLKLIEVKTSLERAAGVGAEIGRHESGALKHCPHYLKIHNAFRKTHMTIAMGNMLTMACTVLHLHYIASKLCVL